MSIVVDNKKITVDKYRTYHISFDVSFSHKIAPEELEARLNRALYELAEEDK